MNLETIRRIGRNRENNKSRPILVKFSDYGDKEKIIYIYSGKCNINSITIEDNFIPNEFKEIKLFQDNFTPLTYPNNAVIILVGVKWENSPESQDLVTNGEILHTT